jgi:hypothetical protein
MVLINANGENDGVSAFYTPTWQEPEDISDIFAWLSNNANEHSMEVEVRRSKHLSRLRQLGVSVVYDYDQLNVCFFRAE